MTKEEMKEEIVERTRQQIDRLFGREGTAIVPDPLTGMSQEAQREYVAKIALLLPLIRKELLYAASQDIEYLARYAKDDLEMFFRRGGISTIDLLLERFERLSAIHQQNIQPESKPTEPESQFPRV